MGNYYYFVAQLPAIVFARDSAVKPPISTEYFADLCHRFLSGNELECAETLSLEAPREGCPTGSAFLDRWYAWDRDLRLALVQFRAAKMKKEVPSNAGAGVTQDIQQIARTACSYDSPLEAEMYLNAERLKKLEDITPLDNFCLDAVYAYGLKLKMAERMHKFDESEGMQSYRIIYDQILGESK